MRARKCSARRAGDAVAAADRAGVDRQSVNENVAAAVHVTALVAVGRTSDASAQDADVLSVVDGKRACEITARRTIDGRVGRYRNLGVGVEPRRIIDEAAVLAACLLACLVGSGCRTGGEKEQVVGDVAVELDTEVFGLEEKEAHGAVVLDMSNRAAIVGTDAGCAELPVLADHTDKDVAREVETRKGDGRKAVTIAQRCVDLCLVRVYAGPFFLPARLDKYVVVVAQGCSFGSRMGEHLMQFLTFLHTLHAEGAALGVLADFSSSLSLFSQSQNAGSVRHLQSAAAYVVAVGLSINVAHDTALHGARLRPVAIEPGAVGPRVERDVVTQIVACRIFDAAHEPVVERTPEVVALLPRHLALVTERTQTELGMGLVATCFLTLPHSIDIMRQRTVVVGVEIIIHGGTVEGAVLQKDAASHAQTVDNGTPVAVGIRTVGLETLHHRKHGPTNHGRPLGRLLFAQQRHCPHQVVGLYGAERCVVAVEALKSGGIGVDDGQCRRRLTFLGKVQRSPHVTFAACLRGSVLAVAGHHLVGAGHLVRHLCHSAVYDRQQQGTKKNGMWFYHTSVVVFFSFAFTKKAQ